MRFFREGLRASFSSFVGLRVSIRESRLEKTGWVVVGDLWRAGDRGNSPVGSDLRFGIGEIGGKSASSSVETERKRRVVIKNYAHFPIVIAPIQAIPVHIMVARPSKYLWDLSRT